MHIKTKKTENNLFKISLAVIEYAMYDTSTGMHNHTLKHTATATVKQTCWKNTSDNS